MIHIIVGTKAQLIKMAPIMSTLQKRGMYYNYIFTGQHKETVDDLRANFGIKEPDVVLYKGPEITNIFQMVTWGFKIIFKVLSNKKNIFKNDKDGIVLNHGDTFSTLLGTLLAKVAGLKSGHVESGLRSYNYFHPFPEEIIRVLVFFMTDYYFCPGDWALGNLKRYKGKKINTHLNTLYDSLIIAKDKNNNNLDIPGEKEFEGRGVSHCATCDGFFYKDRTVAVVGGGDAAAMAAQMLSKIASKVYMIIRRDHLTTEPAREDDVENDPNIEIIRKSNLAKVNGEKMVTSIDLDTGKNIEVDGVFIEIGGIPLTNFAKSLGVDVSKRGRIVVNEKMQTNIAGVYSAGDISTGSAGFDQIVTAASEGAIAARSAFQYLKQNKKI